VLGVDGGRVALFVGELVLAELRVQRRQPRVELLELLLVGVAQRGAAA